MTALANNLAGAGAMLARLVQLGARAGLSAEATLLHILDGAPLPAAETAPVSIAEILERVRREAEQPPAAGLDAIDDELIRATAEELRRHDPARIDIGEPFAAAGTSPSVLSEAVKSAVSQPLKRERVLDLYAATAWRRPRLAELAGTTLGGATFFIREARQNGDPRIALGDALRGGPPRAPAEEQNSPETASEGPRSQVRILPGDSVAFEGAPVAQLGRAGQDGDPGSNPGEASSSRSSMARAPSVSPEGAEEECAERDAGSSDPGEDVAAFPAPPAVQEDAPEMGTVSRQQPVLDAPAAADTAARPAGPGQNLPDTADGMVGGDPGAAAPFHAEEPGDEGVDSESTLTGGERAAVEPAGVTPPMPAGSSPAKAETATDRIRLLWRDGLLKHSEIGAVVGKSSSFVGAILSQQRKKRHPDILAGDEARQRAGEERPTAVVAEVQAPLPEETLPEPLPAVATPRPIDPGHPDDLVVPGPDRVLAIDRGFIIGPAGVLKGFTLINAVLAVLAPGERLDAAVVARKCAIRSGDAVLGQLAHWKDDLAGIGVSVIRSGNADIQLKRA